MQSGFNAIIWSPQTIQLMSPIEGPCALTRCDAVVHQTGCPTRLILDADSEAPIVGTRGFPRTGVQAGGTCRTCSSCGSRACATDGAPDCRVPCAGELGRVDACRNLTDHGDSIATCWLTWQGKSHGWASLLPLYGTVLCSAYLD